MIDSEDADDVLRRDILESQDDEVAWSVRVRGVARRAFIHVKLINDCEQAAAAAYRPNRLTLAVKAKGEVQEWHLLYRKSNKITALVIVVA